MTRTAVVAGTFYEQDPARLRRQLDRVWPDPAPRCEDCLGALVPHAGYLYSGRTAAQVYARLRPAETYFLLGPNHTGRGAKVAVASAQAWETPLGTVPVDAEAARRVLERCSFAQEDDRAHHREHSLEVQLPFLQRLGGEPRIVAVSLGTWELPVLRAVGEAVAEAVRCSGRRCLVLASSDMNHFETLGRTRHLDELALARLRALDPEGLIEVVTREEISMCGAGAAAALLVAALALGAVRAEVVAYATSAEASGDTDRVVGYAGVLVHGH
jgi:AmmeMemoRadiSam system protein B